MRKTWLGSLFITLAAAAAIALAGAQAQEPSAQDSRAVRSVVEAQLQALAVEDPAQAFEFASPGIRGQFGDAAVFMAMVRRSYPMLIRPASISFLRPQARAGGIAQAVQLRDRAGAVWLAVYELEQQPDQSWRISGCAVAPAGEALNT